MSQRRTPIGAFTCESRPKSVRPRAAVKPGRSSPSATPAAMQRRTQSDRYRSKKPRRLAAGARASGGAARGSLMGRGRLGPARSRCRRPGSSPGPLPVAMAMCSWLRGGKGGDPIDLELLELAVGQGAQEVDPPRDLGGDLHKEPLLLLLRALERGRVRRAPVGHDGLPGPDRARLPGPVADRDDEVEPSVPELLPRLAPGVRRVDVVPVLEDPEGERVDPAGRLGAGAERLEAAAAPGAEQV